MDIQDYDIHISFETLSPIMQFQDLQTLAILTYQPLGLVDENCEMLTKSMLNLQFMTLSPDPPILTTSLLTLLSLVPFVKYFLFLESLHLYFDSNSIPKYREHLPIFKRLRNLDFRLFPLKESNIKHVTLFLSRLIHIPLCYSSPFDPFVTVYAIEEWNPSLYDPWISAGEEDFSSNRKLWTSVNMWLPIMLQSQAEEHYHALLRNSTDKCS
ncbi:hypothetical protein M422DRAFT_259292 [Sphaerobolus stellatus SS14]|uniref:Uncharacterized protein n=1 Tax=Sphaerobolus stellatus (strain SS14) TaxID=990650 RepID=A0A0C9VK87_SPHS4|nr:hypothetical protein M422DRAFT_259292 [Sphaerobolus stellatus SS14]